MSSLTNFMKSFEKTGLKEKIDDQKLFNIKEENVENLNINLIDEKIDEQSKIEIIKEEPQAHPKKKLVLKLNSKTEENSKSETNKIDEPELINPIENNIIEEVIKEEIDENIKIEEVKPKEIKEEIHADIEVSEEKEEINEQVNIDLMFSKTGTQEIFKEKWLELYNKALNSDKKTMTNLKIRNGRFRITEAGSMEILPDYDTSGKSSKQLLREIWS